MRVFYTYTAFWRIYRKVWLPSPRRKVLWKITQYCFIVSILDNVKFHIVYVMLYDQQAHTAWIYLIRVHTIQNGWWSKEKRRLRLFKDGSTSTTRILSNATKCVLSYNSIRQLLHLIHALIWIRFWRYTSLTKEVYIKSSRKVR